MINLFIEEEEEEEDIVGYLPPRRLEFNMKGEMELFDITRKVRNAKRFRQFPLVLSAGFFSYLIISNLNVFSFETATIGTYFKLLFYWLVGFTPSAYGAKAVSKV